MFAFFLTTFLFLAYGHFAELCLFVCLLVCLAMLLSSMGYICKFNGLHTSQHNMLLPRKKKMYVAKNKNIMVAMATSAHTCPNQLHTHSNPNQQHTHLFDASSIVKCTLLTWWRKAFFCCCSLSWHLLLSINMMLSEVYLQQYLMYPFCFVWLI